MALQFFGSCKTLDEVKKLYRELCKTHHPDKGGDLATMQAVNNEYAKAVRIIAAGQDLKPEEFEAEIRNAEQYKEAINAIQSLDGIDIEICGGWIWVTGPRTKEYKEIFKQHGFFWAKKKIAWYFRSPMYKTRNHRPMSLDAIRHKYGSQRIERKFGKSLSEDKAA